MDTQMEALERRRARRVAQVAAGLADRVAAEQAVAASCRDASGLVDLAGKASVRVGVVGDVHGETGWVKNVLHTVTRHAVDVVVFVGDFGYWVHTGDGRQFLDDVDRFAGNLGVVVAFVDGNHDNHDVLAAIPHDDNQVAFVRPNVAHLGRGWRACWGGVVVAALGGAVSTDRFGVPGRVTGFDWWPGEAVAESDVDRLVTGGRVDVLFTHDAPAVVSGLVYRPTDPVSDQASEVNRQLLQRAVVETDARLVVHGHHHVRYSDEPGWVDPVASQLSGDLVWRSVRVEGLDKDGSFTDNWLLLDCVDGRWSVTDGAVAQRWFDAHSAPVPMSVSAVQ